MKPRRLLLLVSVLFLPLLLACQAKKGEVQQAGKAKIVTSFYPVYALVKEIAGDHQEVLMLGSKQGIHDYEPSANDVALLHQADVFVYHSKTVEAWAERLKPSLEEQGVKILEGANQLDLDRVQGLEEVVVESGMDTASLYDPHTWLDPIRVGQEAESIANFLAENDAAHASDYLANAKRIVQQAEELTERYQGLFSKVSQKTFVTQHTAFSYLAKRFGLEQLGIAGVAEEEPSPRRLAEIRDFVEEQGVKVLFTERGLSDKLAATLSQSAGVRLAVLDTLEQEPEQEAPYLNHLEEVLETLYRELQ